MKLNIKEIKYIRQSLEHRLIYYQSKPQYSQYAEELKPIIKISIYNNGLWTIAEI